MQELHDALARLKTSLADLQAAQHTAIDGLYVLEFEGLYLKVKPFNVKPGQTIAEPWGTPLEATACDKDTAERYAKDLRSIHGDHPNVRSMAEAIDLAIKGTETSIELFETALAN